MWTNGGVAQAGRIETLPRLRPSLEIPQGFEAGDVGALAPARKRLLRVLVVDDSADTADSLAILVRAWGHAATVAYGGAAALACTRAEAPDAVLMDIAMPRMDGFTLARRIRQQDPGRDVLYIVVTGYAETALKLDWREEGFSYFLLKPPDLDLLEYLLAQHRATQKGGLTAVDGRSRTITARALC